MPETRVLFILKKRGTSYGPGSGCYSTCTPKCECINKGQKVLKSSGLLNSARFVHEMLLDSGIESKLVEVIDNNGIDREVTLFKPTHVVIEALWVVPEKFDVLRKLHPNVVWVIRSHSETPFLAGEGISVEWFFKYLKQENVVISFNTPETTEEFMQLYAYAHPDADPAEVADKVVYLPNYYPLSGKVEPYRLDKKDTIDVGCFGAIRPLKNHLIQAIAAVEFAARNDINLRFHINSTRVEGNADSHKKNLYALFEGLNSPQFQLVEHGWLDHKDFTALVRTMDIGLQMSFTESFNIVTADFVNAGIPVVVSREIDWVHPWFHANPTDSNDIVDKMERALLYKRWLARFLDLNRNRLKQYSISSKIIWTKEYL
jgi:hypothetical protein